MSSQTYKKLCHSGPAVNQICLPLPEVAAVVLGVVRGVTVSLFVVVLPSAEEHSGVHAL